METNKEIYQINKLQLAVLRRAATGESRVYAVLLPNPEIDDLVRLTRLKQEEKLMRDLVNLGLTKDVSSEFSESINKCKIDTKRGYEVHALTDIGQLMFDYCDDPDCGNYHPPGDPSKRMPC